MEIASPSSPNHGEALFVLGGWPRPDRQGVWRSSLFDNGGIGDRLRVEAAAVLYHAAPKPVIVVGGKGKLADVAEAPPCASVMHRELVELGVPAANIRQELNSGNTFEQLQFIRTAISQFGIVGLRILSNRYHLARIDAFLKSDATLADWCARGHIQLQAAEDVLLANDPSRWSLLIAEAYASKEMQKLKEREEEGVRAIQAGTYRC